MGLDFNFGRTQVGVVIFSDTATVGFPLNKYTSKDEVLNAIAFKLVSISYNCRN